MSDVSVTFIQTSDPFRYADMLSYTAKTVRHYCYINKFNYESYVGIKRGFWPWQASYNRIYILEELITRGYDGWVVYLDADAYIVDFRFNLGGFLRGMSDKALVATESRATEHLWDINNGIFMIDLSKLSAIKLVRAWRWAYERVDEATLKLCSDFNMGMTDDQTMLHEILRAHPQLSEILGRCPWDLMNSKEASFIRQQLRVMNPTFDDRMKDIVQAVESVMREL